MASMHIVLVDPLGEVLFSGESLSVREPEAVTPAVDSSAETEPEAEPCPETMRSAGSGVYRSVDPREVDIPEVLEDVGAQIRHAAAKKKRDPRAA